MTIDSLFALGMAVGGGLHELSAFLLNNFAQFVGPFARKSLASDLGRNNPGRAQVLLRCTSEPIGTGVLAEALRRALSARSSHCVVVHRSTPREAIAMLDALLTSGFPFGTAVRYVNLACPGSARLGWSWRQPDAGYLLILALEKLGLATDVRHGTPRGRGSRADADDLIVRAA